MNSDNRQDRQSVARIAVVGAGYWGKNLVRNFHNLGALSVICDSQEERRRALGEQYPDCAVSGSFVDVLGDRAIDAVAIAAPAETHAELVRESLLAGKDVFVEKPLCLSVRDGQALVAMAQNEGRILMVGHLLWYHPAILKLKELIDDGQLGRIEYVYSNRLNLGKIRREENILWSFAPHDISVILGLLNEMPDTVGCQGGNYLHNQIADVTVSNLSFPSGVKAHIFVSWLHPFKEQKLVVVGDRQMAVFDDVRPDNKLLVYPHSVVWKDQIPVAHKAEPTAIDVAMSEPLRAECAHFLECVQTRRRPRTDGAEGLRVLTVLQQCQESLEAGVGCQVSGVSTRDAGVPLGAGFPTAPSTATALGAGLPTPPKPTTEGLPSRQGTSDSLPAERTTDYFAHPSAFIDEGVDIGEGTKIWHVSHIMKGSRIGKKCNIGQNVVIGPNATIGNRVKIQNNVSVYEGVTLEDDVFCGPSMVFTNVYNPRSEIRRMDEIRPTLVGCGATLGANCTIVCGHTIGAYAFVAAGAVVTRDVAPYALVAGVPAKQIGWVCRCADHRLDLGHGETAQCTACGRRYHLRNRQLEEHESADDGSTTEATAAIKPR